MCLCFIDMILFDDVVLVDIKAQKGLFYMSLYACDRGLALWDVFAVDLKLCLARSHI